MDLAESGINPMGLALFSYNSSPANSKATPWMTPSGFHNIVRLHFATAVPAIS
jgi:hypothetical protein